MYFDIKNIVGTEELMKLINELFPGVNFDKVVEFGENAKVARNEEGHDNYEWSTEPDEEPDGESEFPDETYTIVRTTNLDNKVPKFHQDWLNRQVKAQPKNESKVPPSIFDSQETLDRLFGIKKPINEDPPKNAFVFIANRLTFLAQTVQPIIFDTSLIETGENYITIGINEDKTFPKIKNFDDLGRIACQINCDQTIRDVSKIMG